MSPDLSASDSRVWYLARMTKSVCDVLLTEAPLTYPVEIPVMMTGAVLDFWGVVRGEEEGSAIRGIDYQAHRPMAEHQLRRIAREASERFPVLHLLIHHRIGFVPVGEASLLVQIRSRHRAEAFRASEWIVAELKRRVPIWKHPKGALTSKPELATAQ